LISVIRDGMVKTRKEHECHGCLETIPKGTKVYNQTVVGDYIDTLYFCGDCINWCKDRKCRDCIEGEIAFEGYIQECRRNT
jgi:hypothetical protein